MEICFWSHKNNKQDNNNNNTYTLSSNFKLNIIFDEKAILLLVFTKPCGCIISEKMFVIISMKEVKKGIPLPPEIELAIFP